MLKFVLYFYCLFHNLEFIDTAKPFRPLLQYPFPVLSFAFALNILHIDNGADGYDHPDDLNG